MRAFCAVDCLKLIAGLDSRFCYSPSSVGPNGTVSVWQAGLDTSRFPGATLGEKIASAAGSIGATILSPAAVSDQSPVLDPSQAGYIPFTTKAMIDRAHNLGLLVIPWTVSI